VCVNIGTGNRIPDKPNILFAFADDGGKYASCYTKVEGSKACLKILNTFNIDRVAREGILFNQLIIEFSIKTKIFID